MSDKTIEDFPGWSFTFGSGTAANVELPFTPEEFLYTIEAVSGKERIFATDKSCGAAWDKIVAAIQKAYR